MNPYYLHRLDIKKLWGRRNVTLKFFPDINIIIGPNASGKTTVLNIIRYVLNGDFIRLANIEFRSIRLSLKPFSGGRILPIVVENRDRGFLVKIGTDEFELNFRKTLPDGHESGSEFTRPPGSGRPPYDLRRLRDQRLNPEIREHISLLKQLVPLVWLPVSRRLPIAARDDEYLRERQARSRAPIESVDERLSALLRELRDYRFGLESHVSERYKEFERKVLEMMLYSPEHDNFKSISLDNLPGDDEKQLLVEAFDDAGLLNRSMRKRIDQHFEISRDVVNRLSKARDDPKDKSAIAAWTIIPLIPRTRRMIDAAKELEAARETIFAPIKKFEALVNRFLSGKDVTVENDGTLSVKWTTRDAQAVNPIKLSSGEKQILIMLVQALLYEEHPVVYVADEPELSLHVTWQENLLSSLAELGGDIQIIVATHSPDIVGPYRDNVIDLKSTL